MFDFNLPKGLGSDSLMAKEQVSFFMKLVYYDRGCQAFPPAPEILASLKKFAHIVNQHIVCHVCFSKHTI